MTAHTPIVRADATKTRSELLDIGRAAFDAAGYTDSPHASPFAPGNREELAAAYAAIAAPIGRMRSLAGFLEGGEA